MCYQWVLVELQKKIDRIEEDDENYQENRRWKKYRKHQEEIYEKLRKENEQQDERYF